MVNGKHADGKQIACFNKQVVFNVSSWNLHSKYFQPVVTVYDLQNKNFDNINYFLLTLRNRILNLNNRTEASIIII